MKIVYLFVANTGLLNKVFINVFSCSMSKYEHEYINICSSKIRLIQLYFTFIEDTYSLCVCILRNKYIICINMIQYRYVCMVQFSILNNSNSKKNICFSKLNGNPIHTNLPYHTQHIIVKAIVPQLIWYCYNQKWISYKSATQLINVHLLLSVENQVMCHRFLI